MYTAHGGMRNCKVREHWKSTYRRRDNLKMDRGEIGNKLIYLIRLTQDIMFEYDDKS